MPPLWKCEHWKSTPPSPWNLQVVVLLEISGWGRGEITPPFFYILFIFLYIVILLIIFLSFGEENIIEYNNLKGLTVVNSIPANQGGKTIFSIDSLLFLFWILKIDFWLRCFIFWFCLVMFNVYVNFDSALRSPDLPLRKMSPLRVPCSVI